MQKYGRRVLLREMEWPEVEYNRWKTSPDYATVRENAKNRIPVERNLAAVELYLLTQIKRWYEVFFYKKQCNQSL